MRKSSCLLNLIAFVAFVFLAGAAAYHYVPWRSVAVQQLTKMARERGFSDVSIDIFNAGFGEVSFEGLNIKDKKEIYVKNARAFFSLPELFLEKKVGWRIVGLKIKGGGTDIPELSADGIAYFEKGAIIAKGKAFTTDGTLNSDFVLNYPLQFSEKANISFAGSSIKWNGGVLSARDVSVPLFGGDIKLMLTVSGVSLEAFLQSVTGGKAAATGAISGVIPVTLKRDGSVLLQDANLSAEDSGRISISADAIPNGDNMQISLVREVMGNLQYSSLTISANSGPDGKMSIDMKLEGSNPDVQNGRAVKLNVHLTGDVLSLIQTNVTALTNPEKLLERDKNAQK